MEMQYKRGWPGQKEVGLVFDQDKEAGNTVVLVLNLKLYIFIIHRLEHVTLACYCSST